MLNVIDKLSKIIDIEFINEFKKIVKIKCKPMRKSKYTTEYYLYNIILVLTDFQKWKSLELIHNKQPKFHYKTIQDKHLEWSNLNVYEETYRILIRKYRLSKLKKSANLILFIDSALIYNKNGSEKIGYGQNPKKKETKISAICDKDKNIYSTIITKINHKTINKNTLIDDAHTVEDSLKNLLEINLKANKIKLVGDKGYARKVEDREKLFNDFNVELKYPHRRNQKIKTSEETKILLKKRYVIENVFAQLKSFDRICIRKDKLASTYKGFMFLAIILKFKK